MVGTFEFDKYIKELHSYTGTWATTTQSIWAASELAQLGDKRAIPHLIKAFERADMTQPQDIKSNEEFKEMITLALLRLGDLSKIELSLETIAHGNWLIFDDALDFFIPIDKCEDLKPFIIAYTFDARPDIQRYVKLAFKKCKY